MFYNGTRLICVTYCYVPAKCMYVSSHPTQYLYLKKVLLYQCLLSGWRKSTLWWSRNIFYAIYLSVADHVLRLFWSCLAVQHVTFPGLLNCCNLVSSPCLLSWWLFSSCNLCSVSINDSWGFAIVASFLYLLHGWQVDYRDFRPNSQVSLWNVRDSVLGLMASSMQLCVM